MAKIPNNLALWQEEAKKQAQDASDSLKKNNQMLIDQMNESKDNTLKQLEEQQKNSIYNLNTNKSEINSTAENDAKQANINRLLALKSNEQSLNRAGLSSQGIVGSQNASINNSYGANLTSILNQKNTNLRNLEKEKNNTLLEYNTNRLKLENEYGSNLANLQSQIDEKALNQYNNVYNNYLALKQKEYENEQNRQAAAEAKRQWQAEYNLAKRNSSSKSSGNYTFSNPTNNTVTIKTNYYNGAINPDTQYGTFGTKDKNGIQYQPDNIGGNKLKSSGKKVSQVTGDKNFKNSSGIGVGNQTVWLYGNKYVIWNGSKNQYEYLAEK